jgi:toxin ParE1/3/4
MKVRYAPLARVDLREIGLRIAADNLPRSITFVEELVDRCASLAWQPERFPRVEQVQGVPLHKMTHGKYLVLYAITADSVRVLRIVHGARDWVHLLAE